MTRNFEDRLFDALIEPETAGDAEYTKVYETVQGAVEAALDVGESTFDSVIMSLDSLVACAKEIYYECERVQLDIDDEVASRL